MLTNKKKTYKRFFQELAEHKKSFAFLLVIGFSFNILLSVTPMIMAQGIDALIGLLKQKEIHSLQMADYVAVMKTPLLLLVGGIALVGILSFIQEFTMAKISEAVALSLRKKLAKKFKTLPIHFYDTHQVGDIMSRSTSDLKRVSEFLINNVNQMISSVVSLVLGIVFMLYISPILTLVVLFIMIFSVLTTKWIAKKNKVYADKNQKNLGEFSNVTEELYAGNMIIKSFNLQEQSIATFDKKNKEYYDSFKKSQFITYTIYPAIRFLNQLAFIVSAIFGAKLVIQGKMSIGTIQAYLQYVNQISEPVATSSYGMNAIQGALAAIDRVFEILDAEEERSERKQSNVLDNPQGTISFRNVQFGYTHQQLLMDGVSFEAKKSQMIAIVGPTGAGKTTLVNLLMRFYELNGGEILFDGVPINELKRSEYRRLFGMVLQDTWLFEGTIAENIAYGKQDASMEEIVVAAKAAQCDHFIRTLPEGYQTKISNGGNSISQGQQQLLTIARVLLVNPTVIILDEATSSVDTRTEVSVQQAMQSMMAGRTSFVIAHRLSTIKNADLILVMKEGDIVEQGTHELLVEQEGIYAGLFKSQFA